MTKEERERAREKLNEAKERCNWVIKNNTYGGLTADLPYSDDDIELLKGAKQNIRKVYQKLNKQYPPEEPEYQKTKYPFFNYMYAFGYVPWDAHANSLPFTDKFTWEDWKEGVELLRKHNVNLTRFFLVTREGADIDYVVPFKKRAKYDLLDTDCDGYDELYRRLNEFWERDIATMLCMASGIKDVANRFKYSVWNGRNNVNETVTSAKDFMRHGKTEDVLVDMILHFEFEREWYKKPVIYELINEHNANNLLMYNFYTRVVERLVDNGVDRNRIAVEYWNSSKCYDLTLEQKGIIMPHHGCNHVDTMKRLHVGELQKYFHESGVVFMLDSDGQCNNPSEGFYPGVGLVGLLWNPEFRRYAPKHIKPSVLKDWGSDGNGAIPWSAGAYYRNQDGNAPDYKEWKKVAVDGLTSDELYDWLDYYKRIRRQLGLNVPDNFEVDPVLFKDNSGNPLGELKAIKRASNSIFED